MDQRLLDRPEPSPERKALKQDDVGVCEANLRHDFVSVCKLCNYFGKQ